MQIYQGYTIERIDEELTPRQMKNLKAEWKDKPPLYQIMMEINQMLKSLFGIKEQPKLQKGKTVKPEEAARLLQGLMRR